MHRDQTSGLVIMQLHKFKWLISMQHLG